MKKFLSIALVAMTVVFMTGCGVGSSSEYKQGDAMPKIDNSKSTVNGRHYDNDTEKCWKVSATYTIKTSDSKNTKKETRYVWGTEFYLVSLMEMEMWGMAQTGEYGSASYGYVVTTDKDSESCEQRNED